MKQLILSIALLFVTGLLYAQEKTNNRPPVYQPTPYYPPAPTKQELPYSFKHKLKTNNKVVAKVVDPQYAYNKFMKTKNPYKDISFYLGKYTKFITGLDSIGTWETLRNGDRIWRLKLTTQSNLITGIGVHSSKMNIPQGGKLFFYSDDKKTVVGPVTEPNQKGARQFLINSIPGKTIWIEYYEPKAQKGKSTFDIDALLYRFVEFPYGATHRLKKEVPYITPIPEFRELSGKKVSDEERGNGQQIGSNSGYLNLPIDSIGVCETLPNGDRIWRVGIHSRTAFSMDFSLFMKIPESGYLSFYTPDNLYVGSVVHKTNDPITNMLHPGSIPGNRVIIEYYEPAKTKGVVIFRELEINLTNQFTSSSRLDQQPDSLRCSPNIGCLCDQYSTTPEWCSTTLDTATINQLKQSVMRIRTFFECTDPSDPNCKNLPPKPTTT